MAFRAALAIAAATAPADARAEVLAGFFLGTYIGLSVPVIALGIAALFVSDEWVVLGFAVLAMLSCTVAGRSAARGARAIA